MLLGASVRAATPLASADEVGAEVLQMHLSAPRNWRAPVPRRDAEELRVSGRVIAVHATYLCNPASGNPDVREKSRLNLQQTLDAAGTVGAGGVVVHAGHPAGGGDLDDAIDRWVDVVTPMSSDVPLWIENTATGTIAPGRSIEGLGRLVTALRDRTDGLTIGTCFDTCHAWAGDARSAEDPAGYVRAFSEACGGIDLLHVNGSRDEAGAGRDRHANLDDGVMGDAVRDMVVAAAGLGVPALVVETPSEDGGQRRDLDRLRTWLA